MAPVPIEAAQQDSLFIYILCFVFLLLFHVFLVDSSIQ